MFVISFNVVCNFEGEKMRDNSEEGGTMTVALASDELKMLINKRRKRYLRPGTIRRIRNQR